MNGKESAEMVRLKRVLLNDSLNVPNGVLQVLQTDLTGILSSYFEIEENSVTLDVSVDGNGTYALKLTAKGTQAKKIKIL